MYLENWCLKSKAQTLPHLGNSVSSAIKLNHPYRSLATYHPLK